MANFELAIDTVLAHEGGFVDDPHDRGGATNYGISLRWVRLDLSAAQRLELDIDDNGVIDAADIAGLTRGGAVALYREHWWRRYGYGELTSQPLATKLFDLAVNMGNRAATRRLQRALAACGHPVAVDGVLGPITMASANKADACSLLAVLRAEAACFYRALVEADPSQVRFRDGWLARAYA